MAPLQHGNTVQLLLHPASDADDGPLRVVLQLASTNGYEASSPAIASAAVAAGEDEPAAINGTDGAGGQQQHTTCTSFKHIQPALNAVSGTATAAEALYRRVRGTVPRAAGPALDALEGHLLAHLQAWSRAGDGALHVLDDQLDILLRNVACPDAWVQALEALAQHPAAAALLQALQPATDLGLRVVHTVHNHVVPSPYYKAAIDLGTGTVTFASSTSVAKLAARVLHPVVQPFADVANKSEVVHSAIDYWKPTYASTPVSAA